MWGALLHVGLASRLKDWFSEEQIGYYLGLLGFVGGVVGTATQIMIGAASDRSTSRWGRRRPYIVISTLLSFGALMLMGLSRSYWPFAGALVLVQLFTNSALGPFTALLPDTVNRREHGKASGFMGVARLFGDTGGLILGAQLLSAGHLDAAAAGAEKLVGSVPAEVVAYHDSQWPIMCLILAGALLVAMVYTCIAIPERPLERRPSGTLWRAVTRSFNVDITGNPDFFWLSLSRAVTNLGFYMFLEIVLLFLAYAMNVPDPERTSMLILLPAIAMAAASSLPSGILSDRIGRRPLIFAAQFLMAAGAATYALAPSLIWCYIAAIPAGIAYGIFTAVEWALACNLLPEGEAARYLGVWNASAVLPQIFAFPLAGIIGSALASVGPPGFGWRLDFALATVCCLVGAYFLRFVRERPPRDSAP